MPKKHLFLRLVRATFFPTALLTGLLEVFQPNYFSLVMVYAVLGGLLIVLPMSGYALLFVKDAGSKWWGKLLHGLSSLAIGTVVSMLVLVGVYVLPHGKWQKTSPAPELVSQIDIMPNSIEPAIWTATDKYFVYDCQPDEDSKIICAWVNMTDEDRSQASSDNEMTLKSYRFFAPLQMKKPLETVLSARYFADAVDTARFVRFDDQVVHYWVRMWNSYAIFIRGAFAVLIGFVSALIISVTLSKNLKNIEN